MKRTVAVVLATCLFSMTAHAENTLFWSLATGAQAATIVDSATTLGALRRCSTCYEVNPIMKPFAGSRPAVYSASLGLTAVSIYGAYKLKKNGSAKWWLPLVGQIAVHSALALKNRQIR